MRVLQCYLPIFLISLIACKSTPERDSDLRISGFDHAYSLYEANNDSAFYIFNEIATGSSDSLNKAVALIFMGIIQSRRGDYFGAQESLLSSLALLNERTNNSRYYLMSCYYHLGDNSRSLKNYDAALKYYDSSVAQFAKGTPLSTILNARALVYEEKGNYPLADSIFTSVLDTVEINTAEFARMLSNRAWIRWQKNPTYNALPELLRALPILDSLQEYLSVNACYSYIADYYTIPKPDSALLFAQKRLKLLSHVKSPEDELETLDKLINLSPAKDRLAYFNRYKALGDSVQSSRDSAKNQFALIRYETQKTKSDNLELQKDNAQKDLQLLFAIAFTVLAVVIGYAYYRKRIKDNQLKTSQKVHDIVANGIYRTMTAIEHSAFNKEQLLDDLEKLYDQSRDISYDVPTTQQTPFQQVISSLAASYRSSTTSVYVTGNNQSLWDQLPQRSRTQIHMVLQELLVNMKKHSGAENVVIKFEQQNNTINIYYKDDGIGLPEEVKFGNGLTNTGTRIKSIGGEFIFEPATKGLNIRISIPTDRQS